MNKHTPGPWHAALGEKLITDVYTIGDNKQRVFIAECATQRDALLIAAAPTMYEALQDAYEKLCYLAPDKFDDEEHEANWQRDLSTMLAALSQAEGHQHG